MMVLQLLPKRYSDSTEGRAVMLGGGRLRGVTELAWRRTPRPTGPFGPKCRGQ